jgi:hypothetical protein
LRFSIHRKERLVLESLEQAIQLGLALNQADLVSLIMVSCVDIHAGRLLSG